MAKRRKVWVYSPPRPPKPRVPDTLKATVEAGASELVEAVLKPEFVKPPPPDERFNYIVDIYTTWHRSFFYFCATYRSPHPDALSPTFEVRFTRLEYVGDDRFNLAYMRHTGKWWEVYRGLTLSECLTAIRDESLFWP